MLSDTSYILHINVLWFSLRHAAGDTDVPVTMCQAALYAHNKPRAYHATPALTFSDDLAVSAEYWAMQTAHNIHLWDFTLDPNPSGSLGMTTVEFMEPAADFFYTFADVAFVW